MENIQETTSKIINNFQQIKIQVDKIEGIINDLESCKSEYSKSILISAISKISEQIGLKEKLVG